jgi:hypothetical protein
MKQRHIACTRPRAWVSGSRCLSFLALRALPSVQVDSDSGMSASVEAAARFLPPVSWATRTDRNHTRIETGSGEFASFQVALGPHLAYWDNTPQCFASPFNFTTTSTAEVLVRNFMIGFGQEGKSSANALRRSVGS